MERMKLAFGEDSDKLKSEHEQKNASKYQLQDHSKQLEEMAEIQRGKDNDSQPTEDEIANGWRRE